MPMEELIATMRDYAEWADANIWEVPITLPDVLREAADELERLSEPEVVVYDKEETFTNCTVQVLTNTVTGKVSVGWWKEGEQNNA